MNEILWPEDYLPGTTDNFASNEVIVAGLSTADIWPTLNNATVWPSYDNNASDIRFYDGKGPELSAGARFHFATFGFPVEAEVTGYVPPAARQPARVAWHGWAEGDAEANVEKRLDMIHAWLVEDLSGGRVRVLTQESQKGEPAVELAKTRPNPMINGHQDWLDGLVDAARKARGARQ